MVCTADVDARTNTGMTGGGVPVHWLDGGWDDRPTLIANSYSDFYDDEWVNTEYGAYVTGNSAYFHPSAMVWTGCDASGDPHMEFPMGNGLIYEHGRRGHTERSLTENERRERGSQFRSPWRRLMSLAGTHTATSL